MNKPLFLTAVLCLMLQVSSFAQSIKLNNQTDPGSAMLEVSSPSKGILIPNVALTGSTDATTIALPAASLLVYNAATVSDIIPGYYYNSGTAVLPVWSRLSTGTGTGGDGSETKLSAGTNVTVTGSGTQASPYIIDAAGGVGTNTTSYLSKWDGSALVSSNVFDNGTNVGVGTSSPVATLDVEGTLNASEGLYLKGSKVIRDDGFGRTEFFDSDGNEHIELNGSNTTISNREVYITTNLGVGLNPDVDAITAQLDVNGTVQITDGTEGAGKVLTSDAVGNASWQALVDNDPTNELDNTDEQDLANVLGHGANANASAITNLADPTDAQDAATKAYVDVLLEQILELQIVTGLKIKDIDDNVYKPITIGTQTWMAENLKTTRYNDGTLIPLVTNGTAWGTASTNGAAAYSWYNAPNESNNLTTYGALYNWYAINSVTNGNKNVCPTGWHLPTDVEWTTLSTYLGGEGVAGGKMKEAGLAHWTSPNTGATNESGFAGLPGGYRGDVGLFSYIGNDGYWWSSTENGAANAWMRNLYTGSGNVNRYNGNKGGGFSVRCLRD